MTTLLYARRGSERDTLMRAVVLRLLPDEEAEARLRALYSLSSKLWNEVNYVWRRMIFKEKKVDLRKTYREFYERYKRLIGSATAQQVLNKNNKAWRAFFSSLNAKKRREDSYGHGI